MSTKATAKAPGSAGRARSVPRLIEPSPTRGTITVGNLGDFVVFDADLFSIPADAVAGATLRLNVVNGQVAFEGSQAYPPRAT